MGRDPGQPRRIYRSAPDPIVNIGGTRSPAPAILPATSPDASMVDIDHRGDPIAKNDDASMLVKNGESRS